MKTTLAIAMHIRKPMPSIFDVLGLLMFFLSISVAVSAQSILINEIQSSNVSTIYDHTGDTPDWIEIYNNGSEAVNLENFGLSDIDTIPDRWTFPSVVIAPKSHVLIYASGLNLKAPQLYWETIIDMGDVWNYIVPDKEVSGNWKITGFDDSSWLSGKSGFGYGDGDDSTFIDKPLSIFIRKSFNLNDIDNVAQAYLHIDFDDAFVAYLNGQEIARSNIGQSGVVPSFDEPANNYDHEAVMYQGGKPDEFLLENIGDYLKQGENILAIQVHNHSTSSSDLTAIPFFTVGYKVNPGIEIYTSPYINFIPIGLHTNFKISNSGEPIILSDPTGTQIDSVFSAGITADVSLGRSPDGRLDWSFFSDPTPGFANNSIGYKTGSLDSVVFSVKGGIFQSEQTISLSGENSNDSIYFTTNGNVPTNLDHLYNTSLMIDSSVVIRARIIKHGYLPGPVATQTYIVGAQHDLPVVCVNTDPYNLWDNDYGIYVKGDHASEDFPYFGSNFWNDWERPANIAMFETDGTLAFQLNAGIKIFGNYSRGQDQKSLSIHTRKSYGYDGIKYKIFPEKDIDEFKTLVLRNSGNDNTGTMLRDAYCNRIVASEGIDQQAYRPSVVYLNGKYWGIHNIREKVNEEFLSSNHDIDEEIIDILEKDGKVVRGSADHYEAMIDYINTNDLSDNFHYDHIKTQMDVSNYIQYLIAEIFIDNRDWPGNNIKFWRLRNERSKWRWIMFDSDFGMNTWGNNNQEFNTLEFALDPAGPGWPNPPWSTLLFRNLMRNPSFRTDFINAFADDLNTIFDPAILNDQLDEMVNDIEGEISEHLSRWERGTGYWNDRIAAMYSFINQRRDLVRGHIMTSLDLSGLYDLNLDVQGSGSIKLNTLQLEDFPWNGKYYDHIPIRIEAVPKPGFRFVNWIGDTQSSTETISLNTSESKTLTAVFEPLSESFSGIVINEINYNSSEEFDPGDWIELFNTNDFAVNVSGWMLKDNEDLHEYIFPEGTIIPSNGFLVVCRDKEKFSIHFPIAETATQELNFGLGSKGDCVRLFDGAGSLKDEVCYENASPWPENANGIGSTLALKNSSSNNEFAGNWKASVNHGTPGSKNTDIVTGFGDEILSQNLKVYPNPARNEFTVEITGDYFDEISIDLIDMTGRKCRLTQSQPIVEGINTIPITLDAHKTISSGLYQLLIQTKNSQAQIKILIKK